MKRKLLMLLLGALTMFLLAACSGGSDDAGSDSTTENLQLSLGEKKILLKLKEKLRLSHSGPILLIPYSKTMQKNSKRNIRMLK